MPTGYTAAVKDGITFEQFAWSCARNFGALIDMRDAPMDAPVPEKFEVSSYHHDKAEEALARMKELTSMSDEEVEDAARKYYEERKEQAARMSADNDALLKNYMDMLELAKAWKPPSPDHHGLKKFMISQLEESIRFDKLIETVTRVIEATGQEWLQKQIAACLWDVEYHAENNLKEIARVEKRNLWIKQLRESLE